MIDQEQGPDHSKIISSAPSPLFEIEQVSQARAEPDVRGERVFRFLDTCFIYLNSLVNRSIPAAFNPFVQLGAVANTTFVIALITGILLLFWYSPSVNQAYGSMLDIESSVFFAALIRSLHRYSSDACMLFALLHGCQILFARKVGGARWIAWVTGITLVGLLWFAGWTGFWLVWDERAQQIALGSAKLIDTLPFFQDPFSRSFLTDTGVNSLFFFIVFFIHMLIPLAFGIILWVHVIRLNKTTFFTNTSLSAIITVSLILLSAAWPAKVADPARMQIVPSGFDLDWFYLLPIFLTDRLQGGALWILTLTGTTLVLSVPWWIAKKRAQPAVVHEESCNGCTQCYIDCPYNAINLLPRPKERGLSAVFARVDPSKCVGCGVCVGSCDSYGIDQARLPVLDVRRWINQHAAEKTGDENRFIAFICAESAGSALHLDSFGNCDVLPGYQVVPVPCAGWVHMLTVERALRKGAKGVLIAGCDTNMACRKGATWTQERLDGIREPEFRLADKPASQQVRFVRFDRTNQQEFLESATAFRQGEKPDATGNTPKSARNMYITALILILMLGGLTGWLSNAPYQSPTMNHGELVVTFKHAGQHVEAQQSTNDNDRLSHMQGATATRMVRMPVRLKVLIDDVEHLSRSYEAGGLFNDGSSVAVETFSVSPGVHKVEVFIGDSENPNEWNYSDSASVSFTASERRIVQFEVSSAFSWD